MVFHVIIVITIITSPLLSLVIATATLTYSPPEKYPIVADQSPYIVK